MPLTDHADCVLVVIDVQPGFITTVDVVERQQGLISLARALDVPVIATEEEPERNGPSEITPALLKPTFGLAGTPEILSAVRATIVGGEPITRGPELETQVAALVQALVAATASSRDHSRLD